MPAPAAVEAGVVIDRTVSDLISFSLSCFLTGSASSKNCRIGLTDVYWTAFNGLGAASSCTGAGVC